MQNPNVGTGKEEQKRRRPKNRYPLMFAFPYGDGRWRGLMGGLVMVEGYFHKISVPGFETRSGGGFGITATFHVAQNVTPEGPIMRAMIRRVVVQNGRVMSNDLVAAGVEIDFTASST
jgi:hypothetical protein